MNVLSRLGLGQKLGLVLFVLLIPITYLTFQHVTKLQQQMHNDELGLDGLRYVAGLQDALVPLTRHEALSVAATLAGSGPDARIGGFASEVDSALAEYAKAHDELRKPEGVAGAEIDRLSTEIQNDWTTLKTGWPQMRPDSVQAAHVKLVKQTRRLAELIGAEHMLNRGMDYMLLYVKTVVSQHLVDAQVALGDLRLAVIKPAASRAPVTAEDLLAVGGASATLEAAYGKVERGLEAAVDHPQFGEDFRRLQSGPAAAGARAMSDYEQWVIRSLEPGRPVGYGTSDVLERGKPVVEALDALDEGFGTALKAAMEARYAASASQRNVGVALVAVLLATAIALGVLIARGIIAGMREALGVFGQIQQGNFSNAIVVKSTDEVGQVLKGLDEMQGKLKEQIERDRRAAAENERIRTALDKVTTNVMLADADGQIIYMNEAVTGMFRHNAAEIRKQLPAFDPDRILNHSFDQFHRSPAHQRNMLGALNGTHSSQLKLGNATLKIVANPVFDKSGVRLGTVVQWFDRTEEVATEEEVQLVVQAALDGDLTRRIRREGKTGFFANLADGMNSLLENMAGVVRMITRAAREVSTGADEISKGNANLSQRTEEQASSLEETASSMEEMTSTVKQNADNAQQANQLAISARSQAEKGGAVVSQAVSAMNEINASSKKIADIIGVIDEIAFQTNLLALNAAVEAARAGEQGRGFAVVASEVRNLASRSAEAAKEIKSLIQDSVAKVGDGAKLVDQSGQTLAEIVAAVKKVTDIVAEISAASQEQSAGIEQVNKAVMSMDEVTQQNAALVEEAAAAAEALMEQARSLNETMAKYRAGEEPAAASHAGYEGPERRSAQRPWAGRSAAEPRAGAKGGTALAS